MAITNADRVGKALELLNKGLQPFVEREMKAVYGDNWPAEAVAALKENKLVVQGRENWDSQALLTLMWNRWTEVFRRILGHAERSLVSELREARNRWAHQELFSTDDGYRILDSVSRLLSAVSAPEAAEVEKQKMDLLRQKFEEQARNVTRKVSVAPVEGQPSSGLRPWREVITPHQDVARGTYQQAEFAADLWQVHVGEGASSEYTDPTEFFRRTYLTQGLRGLLSMALQRLSGRGGDPVVELQTNFGGGKTHSMLALYHLFSGAKARDLVGLEAVLGETGTKDIPRVNRAVLVGTKISPGQPERKKDGTLIRTLWGEMAYQLGEAEGGKGAEAYELVREADETATNPGDAMRKLFNRYGPCLILIDEWVAYARQLHDDPDLPGGSFETHFTFAQALTEAVKASPQTLLVVSIPASEPGREGRNSAEIEVGGERGKAALARLKNAIGRIQSPWRPATGDESFEIVRRRLFEPIPTELLPQRDAVIKGFMELYRSNGGEFPSVTRESGYEAKLKAAYPIHPELFERLYSDWSSLEKFQRTRGVLRLMAAVIHELWERNDKNLLIMPANVPVDAGAVQSELTRYLEDNWVPVIERDVDGPESLPLRLDRENANLGKYSATRRVARTLYLGSAPTLTADNRGLEDRNIKLGCAQPGELVATFGDALRRLTDQATHLYVNGQRYWFSTQPSVNRLAQERAEKLEDYLVSQEIERRLKDEARERGDFPRIHVCPESSGDVPDEHEAALVVLGPAFSHVQSRESISSAQTEAQRILESRGNKDRIFKNTLAFLAADKRRVGDLEQSVRMYLAWKSVETDGNSGALNLDNFQRNLTQTKRSEAERAIKARIPETFNWLLIPTQVKGDPAIAWLPYSLQGQDALAVRASKKLKGDGRLDVRMAGTVLRREMDRIPLWRGDHVGLKQLTDDFATYVYLPRLRDPGVLLAAVCDGIASPNWLLEGFAYADAWDEQKGRYLGLRAGPGVGLPSAPQGVLVKPEIAAEQLEREKPIPPSRPIDPNSATDPSSPGSDPSTPKPPVPPQRPSRFRASVRLEPTRLSRDADQIAREVLQHLLALDGAEAEVDLEIQVRVRGGISESVERTVGENARTLQFRWSIFESE
jgi:predicted AAA+ superfamily ATPase